MSHLTSEEEGLWFRMIQRLARYICRDYPDVDSEELEHTLWVHILTYPSLDIHNPGCWNLMKRIAAEKAWDQRKEQLNISSQYSYTVHDVCRILETSFFYNDWESGYVPEDARSKDAMDGVEVRSDVMQAFYRLKPKSYQHAILGCYRDGVTPAGSSNEGKLLARAVDKLVTLLNWYWNGPNTRHPGRKTISNAAARYRIEQLTEDV